MSIHPAPIRHHRAPPAGQSPQPHPPIMSLSSSSVGAAERRARLITVCGEIDMSNAHLLVQLVELAIDQRPTWVLVDLSQVTFFGAHAITALLQADDTAVRAGGLLTVRDAPPFVRRVLAVTGTEHQLNLADPPLPAMRLESLPTAQAERDSAQQRVATRNRSDFAYRNANRPVFR